MRLAQITPPATHPHVLHIDLDPVDLHRLRSLLADDPDDAARVIQVNRSQPDRWRVSVACASRAVRDALDDGWA
jgi:hypothetical protein